MIAHGVSPVDIRYPQFIISEQRGYNDWQWRQVGIGPSINVFNVHTFFHSQEV